MSATAPLAGVAGVATLRADSDGALWRSDDTTARAPRLGRYVVRDLIGTGGMGVVFSAYDPELDRRVAIKVIAMDHEDAEARLTREAQAMARLSHPNVVTVHEVMRVGTAAAIVMQLIDGPNLEAWQADSRPRWRETLAVYLQAAQGLAAAHRAGLVHRDFKPSNALLDGAGVVHVTDFGLVRATGTVVEPLRSSPPPTTTSALDAALTRTGSVMGTPLYMAPEQHLGGAIDARTDQWAFACSLYEALYRQRPFGDDHDDLALLRSRVVNGDVRPEPSGSPVPRSIRTAIGRALSASPDQRFAKMEELIAALSPPPARRGRRLLFQGLPALIIVALVLGLIRQARLAPVPPSPVEMNHQLWRPAGSHPENYATGIDTATLEGQPVSYLHSAAGDGQGFGTLMQTIDARPYLGRRVTLSTRIRSEKVEGWAGLWMRVDARDRAMLAFDNMQDRPIKGTTGWTRYATTLDVSHLAEKIAFGVLLSGTGRVLFHDVQISFVPVSSTPTTAQWQRLGPDPEHYRTGPLRPETRGGAEYVESLVPEAVSIALGRSVDARPFRRGRVRLSAALQGDNVARKAGLWIRIDGQDRALAFDCEECRPLTGSTGVGRHQGVVDIPIEAEKISYGVFLEGTGRLRFEHVQLTAVRANEPVFTLVRPPAPARAFPSFRPPADVMAQPMAPRPTTSLRGRLVDDETGRPLVGTPLVTSAPVMSHTTTDVNGLFVLRDLPTDQPFAVLVKRARGIEELDEGLLPAGEAMVDIGTRRLIKIDWNRKGLAGGQVTKGMTGIEDQMRADGRMMVTATRTGYPAERAGIRPGDRVLSIDGKSMDGLSHASRSHYLTGIPGSQVAIHVEDPLGATRTVILTRQDFSAPGK